MKKSLALLINPGAGSVPARIEDSFIDSLTEAASWADVEIQLLDNNFEQTIRDVCEQKRDIIAVAGGDGTARSVCEIVAEREIDCQIMPLPLGTANILPKRLYGDRDWRTVLEEAPGYREVKLHAGGLDGKLFFVAASVGFLTRFAEAREAVRDDGLFGGLGGIWRHASAGMESMLSTRLSLYADGAERRFAKVRAVMLAPGGIDVVLDTGAAEAGRPKLEIVTADPRHMSEVASLGVSTLMQQWRDHPRIRSGWVETLKVDGRDTLDVMLDGEPMHLKAPIEFNIKSEAVRFLAADG